MSLDNYLHNNPTGNNFSGYLHIDPMGMGYTSGNDVVLSGSDRPYQHKQEARTMDTILKSYLRSEEGQKFVEYASSQGRKFIDIVGAGSADLGEHIVAALISDGEKGVIVGNYEGKNFQSRVQNLAYSYRIEYKAALEYVLTHEMAHAAGNHTEQSNEAFLKEYFLQRAGETEGYESEKYQKLAEIAEQREEQAHYQENN